jgi:hypothetical protein
MWRVGSLAEAHDAVIRVCGEEGNVIQTQEQTSQFEEP